MNNNWRVFWIKAEGGKAFKQFNHEKPTKAIAYAKELKRKGLKPWIVSTKSWRPTEKQEVNRRPGMLWCPYCIKWRNFKLLKVKKPTFVSEAFMRCPYCLISTNDFFVKKYNGFLEHMTELDIVKKLSRLENVSA